MTKEGRPRTEKSIKRPAQPRTDEMHRRKIIEEVGRIIEKLPEMPRGTATAHVGKERS
jgi:hypothetical protein